MIYLEVYVMNLIHHVVHNQVLMMVFAWSYVA